MLMVLKVMKGWIRMAAAPLIVPTRILERKVGILEKIKEGKCLQANTGEERGVTEVLSLRRGVRTVEKD